jgi:hypothetical protein
MTDSDKEGTLVDYTEGTMYEGVRSSIKVCHHCPKEEYGKSGKPILPNTPDYVNGKQTADGFVCGTCIETDKRKRDVRLLVPHDRSTNWYVIKEQKRVDFHNSVADEVYKATGIRRHKLTNKYQQQIAEWYERMKNLR